MIKIALPAGDLRSPIAAVLDKAGLRVEGYGEGSRAYRFDVSGDESVVARVFREKDIPVQVALGNYDVGICSWSWVSELRTRFPGYPVVPLCGLGEGAATLFAAVSPAAFVTLEDVATLPTVRIASEFPNIAERLAQGARLRAYRVQRVWGAAEAYPPEDADLVLLSARDEAAVRAHGLQPVFRVLESSAWLIANRDAVSSKDLGPVIGPLLSGTDAGAPADKVRVPAGLTANGSRRPATAGRTTVRLAVPDGHQQRHAQVALEDAGIRLEGYDGSQPPRRPACNVDGLEVKVIRPHDMPHLIATGEFDLAVTGRDCLHEHLYSFPSSPVEEVADLQRGQYNLCAVVSQDVPDETIADAMARWRSEGRPYIRIASEFPATADHYARSRHLWRYRVIPIAGASEGFVPEDAELLIEGTETGRTLRENNLKPIDTIYRSTTCAIARKNQAFSPAQAEVFDHTVSALRKAGAQAARSA
jgi:ATP phosphoribosyltransferase